MRVKGQAPMDVNAFIVTLSREKCKGIIFKLGVAEMVLGCLSCVLCIGTVIGVAVGPQFDRTGGCAIVTYISTGLWNGVLLIACGVTGTRIAKKATAGMFCRNKALSLAASICTGITLVVSIAAATANSYREDGVTVMHSMLAMVSTAAVIVTVMHCCYSCVGNWVFPKPPRTRRSVRTVSAKSSSSVSFCTPRYDMNWNTAYWNAQEQYIIPPYATIS